MDLSEERVRNLRRALEVADQQQATGISITREETQTQEPMGFDEYQQFSMSRAGITFAPRDRLALAGLGLTGEAGEVADLVKKAIYHGAAVDREKLILEAGDVLWYVAYLADALGVPLSRIAEANREKLLRRYPNGFSVQDAARRRDEVTA